MMTPRLLLSSALLGATAVVSARIAYASANVPGHPSSETGSPARRKKKHVCAVEKRLVPGCEELKVFSGSAHPEFAREVARHLGTNLAAAHIGKFADGEISIKIDSTVRGRDVYVIQPTGPPVNDNLLELLFMISALREASAKKVTAVVPYFGYMRSDGSFQRPKPFAQSATETGDTVVVSLPTSSTALNANNPPNDDDVTDNLETHRTSYLAMADVAKMFEVAGCSCLVTLDLHASGQSVAEGFFSNTTVENLRSGPLVAKKISELLGLQSSDRELVVVAPHSLCFSKAKKFQSYLKDATGGKNVGLALVVRRPAEGTSIKTAVDLVGDVKGKDVLIVEDVVDTGRSLSRGARAAKEGGANRVFAFASHALLTGDAPDRLMRCEPLERVLVMNTSPISAEARAKCTKLEVMDAAPMVADLLAKLHMIPLEYPPGNQGGANEQVFSASSREPSNQQ